MNIQKLIKNTEKQIEALNMDYHKITNLLFSEPFMSIKTYKEKM